MSGGGGGGGGGAASLASSRKKEKSKMKKKKPQQEKLKLCIIGLTQENEVVECQLETAKNHTVNFKFNCDEDEPQEIANNLVRNRRSSYLRAAYKTNRFLHVCAQCTHS